MFNYFHISIFFLTFASLKTNKQQITMATATEFFAKEKKLKAEIIKTIIDCVKQTSNKKINLDNFTFNYYDEYCYPQESYRTQLELDENEKLVIRVDCGEDFENVINANDFNISAYALISVLYDIEE